MASSAGPAAGLRKGVATSARNGETVLIPYAGPPGSPGGPPPRRRHRGRLGGRRQRELAPPRIGEPILITAILFRTRPKPGIPIKHRWDIPCAIQDRCRRFFCNFPKGHLYERRRRHRGPESPRRSLPDLRCLSHRCPVLAECIASVQIDAAEARRMYMRPDKDCSGSARDGAEEMRLPRDAGLARKNAPEKGAIEDTDQ